MWDEQRACMSNIQRFDKVEAIDRQDSEFSGVVFCGNVNVIPHNKKTCFWFIFEHASNSHRNHTPSPTHDHFPCFHDIYIYIWRRSNALDILSSKGWFESRHILHIFAMFQYHHHYLISWFRYTILYVMFVLRYIQLLWGEVTNFVFGSVFFFCVFCSPVDGFDYITLLGTLRVDARYNAN